jgi:lipopolysaccharide transport system ATP-binding protein
VAALLELGIGFHPDFTGRQNVVMAGQLLGYSMRELESMMPEIEAFCEVGDYMDQPVRVYSSGMQMRLAFGVATARRPDVLIVDEALSVGDAYFQHKSFERIRQFQRQGTSLLLVSHDKQAVLSLCDTAIMLHGGGIAMQGAPEAVMDYYNAMLASHQNQRVEQLGAGQGAARTISGTGEAQVTSICLRDESGLAVEVVDVGQKLSLDVHVLVHSALERLVFGYGIKDRLGRVIYGTNTSLKDQVLHDVPAGARYRFDIAFEANLGPGSYSVQTAVVSTETHLVNNYEWRDRALVFTVVNLSREHFDGCAWMDATIDIKTLCD